jgi:DNA-binding transcriptional ArsR family regulator
LIMSRHAAAPTPVASAQQARALAHATRVRIWTALATRDATISQLSHQLRLNKGSVSHHLKVLVATGLARPVSTRTVREGTERYFARVDQRLAVPHERGPGTAAGAWTRALVREIDAAGDPHVHQRTIRLTDTQAQALVTHLDELLHRLAPADERHPVYGVVTAVYRKG